MSFPSTALPRAFSRISLPRPTLYARPRIGRSRAQCLKTQQTPRRCFMASARRDVSTAAMTEEQLAGLRVDRERLMRDLHETCKWGMGERWGDGPTDIGMSRLTLTDADKTARDWFVDTTKELGCNITIDQMGNTFAVRPGRKDGPPTVAGSHLDTQPTGGRYDGILGVHAGVEMLKVLKDQNIETEFPVGVVNWTNEEGARFPISMVASGVWAGSIRLEHAHNLQEVGGGTATMKTELERIGYLGSVPASHKAIPLAAHFELHIEQGPLLEASGQKIGAVVGVQAYKWFTITVRGRDCHTGTTAFPHRSDAMLTASSLIVHSHHLAAAHDCLASTGILTLKPGSTNTVPGFVQFSLDMRTDNDAKLEAFEKQLREDFARIAAGEAVQSVGKRVGRPCEIEWRLDTTSPKVDFHDDCIKCVEQSASGLFGAQADKLTRRMVSGAGHDSVYTSKRIPTAMIFAPCRDGVSHNPSEYCAPEDCANGADVLLGAVLRYDRLRAQRGV